MAKWDGRWVRGTAGFTKTQLSQNRYYNIPRNLSKGESFCVFLSIIVEALEIFPSPEFIFPGMRATAIQMFRKDPSLPGRRVGKWSVSKVNLHLSMYDALLCAIAVQPKKAVIPAQSSRDSARSGGAFG